MLNPYPQKLKPFYKNFGLIFPKYLNICIKQSAKNTLGGGYVK